MRFKQGFKAWKGSQFTERGMFHSTTTGGDIPTAQLVSFGPDLLLTRNITNQTKQVNKGKTNKLIGGKLVACWAARTAAPAGQLAWLGSNGGVDAQEWLHSWLH